MHSTVFNASGPCICDVQELAWHHPQDMTGMCYCTYTIACNQPTTVLSMMACAIIFLNMSM
jgi:hypothetical protein